MSITPCFIVVHSLSHVQLFVTPWTATQQASRSFTIYWTCSNSCPLSLWCYLISHPLLPPSPPALNLSWASGSFPMSQLFASGGQRKYWAFSFSIHPSNDIQGWFPLESTGLICLQSRELSGSLQHHNSKASILWHWAFFVVQLLHPYMATGKTITLTMWTFVGKVKSLLFNMLSRFVIVFFQEASVF